MGAIYLQLYSRDGQPFKRVVHQIFFLGRVQKNLCSTAVNWRKVSLAYVTFEEDFAMIVNIQFEKKCSGNSKFE